MGAKRIRWKQFQDAAVAAPRLTFTAVRRGVLPIAPAAVSTARREGVSELLDAELPPYTTALDAALPDENIVLALYSPRRGRWAAVHETPSGKQVLVWAAGECLARRRAALKARGADLLSRAAAIKPAVPSHAEPAPSVHGWSRIAETGAQEAPTQETEAPEEGETEWKILF